MKIAQIAPLMESVPPRLYGGTERIVSYLTEELVNLGHDVTLFASGDSITAANLVPCVPQALRLDASVRDTIPYYMLMLDRVRQQADDFDILHFHIDQFHFPLFRPISGRTVTTLHGRQDLTDLLPLYLGFGDMPLVSISNAQRRPIPNANFAGTVHHGIPAHLHRGTPEARGGYLAFLGRISPEKRPDRAIAIARAAGIPLKIAAKVDRADAVYFKNEIEPLLTGGGVEFIGEINDHAEIAIPGRRTGAAVSNRLARAVRALHDRGDGLRNAGAGVSLWLGSRDRRGWHHRRHRRHHGRGDRRPAGRHCARSKKGASAFRPTFFRHTNGERLCWYIPVAAGAVPGA